MESAVVSGLYEREVCSTKGRKNDGPIAPLKCGMHLPVGFGLLSASLLSSALAAYIGEHVVKHAWQDIPEGWEMHSVPASDHPITLKIGLKQSRIDDLIETLYEVSDPLHPNYGQHLSRL